MKIHPRSESNLSFLIEIHPESESNLNFLIEIHPGSDTTFIQRKDAPTVLNLISAFSHIFRLGTKQE